VGFNLAFKVLRVRAHGFRRSAFLLLCATLRAQLVHFRLVQRWCWNLVSFISVFGVNCLQLEVLDCLNFEVGGSNILRKLVIIYRASWNDI